MLGMVKTPPRRSRKGPVVKLGEPGVAYEAPLRSLQRLVDVLGNNRLAKLLHVAASQPSRWARGLERLSPDNQRRVLDLDYALSRLLLIYPPRQAEIWLRSHNATLGARPVDVILLHGAAAVIQAVDVEEQGAFV